MIDWQEVSNRFEQLKDLIEWMAIPPQQIIDQHRAHLLTGGLVGSKLANQSPGELFAVPGSKFWMQRAHQLLDDWSGDREAWASGRTILRNDWRDIIGDAIARKTVSTEFLEAWQFFGILIGRYTELDEMHQASTTRFKQALAASIKSDNAARLCWFSYCLTARKAESASARRIKAEEEIHKIILSVLRGHVVSPVNAKHYTKDWFGRMVVHRKKRYTGSKNEKIVDFLISESFTRLHADEVASYSTHDYIKPEFLPPLYIKDFKPVLKP